METTHQQPAQSEHDAYRPETAGAAPGATREAAVAEPGAWLAGKAFSGAPGEPPGDGVASLLSGPSLAHSANDGARVVALRRAQQTHGNRYVQRLVSGLHHGPSRLVQRTCVCGGTCTKCQAEAA